MTVGLRGLAHASATSPLEQNLDEINNLFSGESVAEVVDKLRYWLFA
jgi:hypothetical protein